MIKWLASENATDWDRVRIYHSATEAGTFTLLDTVDIANTEYFHEAGLSTDWYKLAWYNTVTSTESTLTDAFNVTSVPVISPKMLRWWMGLSDTEEPNDSKMISLIVDANTEMQTDLETGMSTAQTKLALKYISASYICQWRAQRLISSGNVNFAIDGVSVQKPYAQWMERAKQLREEYDQFIWKFADESMSFNVAEDAGYDEYSVAVNEIIWGINNARNRQDIRSLYGVSDTVIVQSS